MFVHGAAIALDAGVDPAAPGAVVTTALCGHWEHEPPCRWPHNSRLVAGSHLRTVFVCWPGDEATVRGRIDTALRSAPDWSVLHSGPQQLEDSEQTLAANLAAGPHL